MTRAQMLLAYAAGSFGFGYQGMITFLLPLRAHELSAPLAAIGLIVGAGSLLPALLSIPSGDLADRLGPRAAFVAGTAISSLTALAFAATPGYWGLLVMHLVHGLARNTAWVAAQTYITGVGTPAERSEITGRFSFWAMSGFLLAPLAISGIAELIGYQLSFVAVALIGAGYTALGLLLPAQEKQAREATAPGSGAGFGPAVAMLRLRGVQVAILFTFARLWLTTGWLPFFQLFLADQGFRPALIGVVTASSSASSVAATLTAGRLSRLASKEAITAGVLLLGAVGVTLSAHVTGLPVVFLPPVLVGLAGGLTLPLLIAIISDYAPAGQRGVAMGVRMTASQAANMAAPMASGALVPALGVALGFAASAACLVGLVGAALWLFRSGPGPRADVSGRFRRPSP